MAPSDDRRGFCSHWMFEEYIFEDVRKSYIADYYSTSPYLKQKITPSVPIWCLDHFEQSADEDSMMHCHFIDPSSQELSMVFCGMKPNVQLVIFNAVQDSKGGVISHWGMRCMREFIGMPILNNVSIGGPVTKLQPPKTHDDPLYGEFFNFRGENCNVLHIQI